jgi:hypothetical protein
LRYLLAYPLSKALEQGYRYIPGEVVRILREARDTEARKRTER